LSTFPVKEVTVAEKKITHTIL